MSGMKTCAFLRLPHHTQTGPVLSSPAPSWTPVSAATLRPELLHPSPKHLEGLERLSKQTRGTKTRCAEVLFVVCLSRVSSMAAFRTHISTFIAVFVFFFFIASKC